MLNTRTSDHFQHSLFKYTNRFENGSELKLDNRVLEFITVGLDDVMNREIELILINPQKIIHKNTKSEIFVLKKFARCRMDSVLLNYVKLTENPVAIHRNCRNKKSSSQRKFQ